MRNATPGHVRRKAMFCNSDHDVSSAGIKGALSSGGDVEPGKSVPCAVGMPGGST
jgi:hypothetical protein